MYTSEVLNSAFFKLPSHFSRIRPQNFSTSNVAILKHHFSEENAILARGLPFVLIFIHCKA